MAPFAGWNNHGNGPWAHRLEYQFHRDSKATTSTGRMTRSEKIRSFFNGIHILLLNHHENSGYALCALHYAHSSMIHIGASAGEVRPMTSKTIF